MDFSTYIKTDLGKNCIELHKISQSFSNSIFVDLGVREGYSSALLSDNSTELNNKIYGVDVNFDLLKVDLVDKQNYLTIEGDSSTVGREWKFENIDILFVDTLHVKEQVLCELYYWIDKMNENSYIIFHDSHWPQDMRENICGIIWDRVDDAIVEFFGLSELKNQKNKYIEISCFPESYGMTFVKINKKQDFKKNIKNWETIFKNRNKLISYFWNENNIKDKIIDLEISLDV